MASKFYLTAKKIQTAINQRSGCKILLNSSQWYSPDKKRTITIYTVKQTTEQEKDGKYKQSIELFKTYSQIQLVLYLRDYWYELNGWEIPKNEIWETIKNGEAEIPETSPA